MIGLFDSGYGGLTILKELTRHLPQYSYVYFGDNANAPYGDKNPEEIYELTRAGVEYLFSQGSELVILACNTASAVALRRMQQQWLPKAYPNKRVLGIIVPTIEQITGVPWDGFGNWELGIGNSAAQFSARTVAVLATPATVASGAYEHEVHKRNSSVRVVQQACPALVPIIENGASDEAITRELQSCLDQLNEKTPSAPGALLLGCTHYALIAQLIKPLLAKETHLYEQPGIVSKSLVNYLQRHSEIESRLDHTSTRTFYTSGDPAQVSRLAARFYGEAVGFQKK